MKKLIVILVGIAFASVSVASTPAMRIGIVDTHRILLEAPQAKVIGEKINKQFKTQIAMIKTKEAALKADVAKYEKNAAVMTNKDKKALQTQILQGRQALSQLDVQYQKQAGTELQKARTKFIDKLEVVVQRVAKEKKFDMVIDRGAVPFYSKKVDITDTVIKRLS